MPAFHKLSSKRGDALIGTLIGFALVLALALGSQEIVKILRSSIRSSSAKRMMSTIEVQYRFALLNSPGIYTCTDPPTCNNVTVNWNNIPVHNGGSPRTNLICGSGSSCSISTLIPPNPITKAGSVYTLNFSLAYNDPEMRVKPLAISLQIPEVLITGAIAKCPIERPIFKGIDGNGALICAPIINTADARCPPGQYISQIDPVTLQATCRPVINGGATTQDCRNFGGATVGGYIGSISWNSSGGVNLSCQSRVSPWFCSATAPSYGPTACPQ